MAGQRKSSSCGWRGQRRRVSWIGVGCDTGGILGGTAGISILGAKVVERDANFCVRQFIALQILWSGMFVQ